MSARKQLQSIRQTTPGGKLATTTPPPTSATVSSVSAPQSEATREMGLDEWDTMLKIEATTATVPPTATTLRRHGDVVRSDAGFLSWAHLKDEISRLILTHMSMESGSNPSEAAVAATPRTQNISADFNVRSGATRPIELKHPNTVGTGFPPQSSRRSAASARRDYDHGSENATPKSTSQMMPWQSSLSCFSAKSSRASFTSV